MFRLLPFKSRTLIGLDIQADEIRLLQVRQVKQKFIVDNVAVVALSPGALVEGKIQQFENLRVPIRELVERLKIHHYPVAIAMPAHCVISKRVQIAAGLQDIEREVEISTNLYHYFPGMTEELCFDHIVLGAHNAEEDDVLLVAARYEQLQSYVSVVERAGLTVKIVDVDIYALVRGLHFILAPANLDVIALLEVGAMGTQLIIFSRHEVIFSQQFSTTNITELEIQLKRTLHRTVEIKKLFLSGNMEKLVAIAPNIQRELSIEVHYVNPFQAMSLTLKLNHEAVESLASRMLLSCGLALRKIPSW